MMVVVVPVGGSEVGMMFKYVRSCCLPSLLCSSFARKMSKERGKGRKEGEERKERRKRPNSWSLFVLPSSFLQKSPVELVR